MSLGERFRSAREERGLTLSDVAEQIRIRSVYLAAIEEENWASIGAPVYVRGFLRTYARFLNLDPEDAVSTFNASAPASATASPVGEPSIGLRPGADRNLSPIIWVAGAIAVVLIAFVIYLFVSPPHPGGPGAVAALGTAAASTTPSPAALATARPAAEPSAPLASSATLAIHLTAASWLRVTVDGNVSIEGTFPAGTSRTFHGKSALVRVGNAGGVEIIVDGKPIGKLGPPGDVAEKTFTL